MGAKGTLCRFKDMNGRGWVLEILKRFQKSGFLFNSGDNLWLPIRNKGENYDAIN